MQGMLSVSQNLIGEIGRGSGKTTEIFARRFVTVCYDMPRSLIALAGPSYIFVLDTILPGLLEHLNKYYKRGIHFEYGKRPPAHFKRPYTEVTKWNHTISFAWGTVVKFIGVDRPDTSGIGKSMAHIFIDELLRIDETNFVERLNPTMRGDRSIHGRSQYFGGVTGFSSTPNFENDHDWWLSFEKNMDKELRDEIVYAAYRISTAGASKEQLLAENKTLNHEADLEKISKNISKIEKLTSFVARWSEKLRQKSKGATIYLKGSSFSNLLILGLDYIKNQYQGSRNNFDKFKLSILGIRPEKVKNMFFAKFSKKNIFDDSYKYNDIEVYTIDKQYRKTSRDLKYCDSSRPLLAGFDPGGFMSIVFAQERKKELRVIKNFYKITPEQHFEMATAISQFFEFHTNKVIYLYYDRDANKHREKYRNNPKGDTDAKILQTELKALGWTVKLMNIGSGIIEFWKHYLLLERLLSEREKNTPRVRICQNECEELVSSIYMSPLKKNDNGGYELDKSSEKLLDYEDQAFFSTQIATSLMYLIYNLYEKLLPEGASKETVDFQGL